MNWEFVLRFWKRTGNQRAMEMIRLTLWSPEEIRQVPGDSEEARAALNYRGVDTGLNFEGKSILYVPRDPAQVGAELKLSPERVSELIAGARCQAPTTDPEALARQLNRRG